MIHNLPHVVDEYIFHLYDVNGNKFYRTILKEGKDKYINSEEDQGAFLALQFLIIPFLSTLEIADLLQWHLYAGLLIDDLELSERVKKKLIFMDLSNRDDCKNALKNAILKNKEKVTEIVENGDKKISTVKEWLLDYANQEGAPINSSLGKAKYMNQKSHVLRLNSFEKELVKKLISFYQFLNISSFTPEGFEDDLLVKRPDGTIVTTHNGDVVVLFDPNKQKGILDKKPRAGMLSGPPKTESEKNIEKIEVEKQSLPASSLERLALDEEVEKQKHLEDLQYQATKFSEGSLERMALEEEISRLRK